MKQVSNVHTHCNFCDGANTPREVVERALELGFTDIGFSSHAPAPFDKHCGGIQDEVAYRAEIAALKKEYAGRITILCGVEQDTYALVDASCYDYILHSTHYLPAEGPDLSNLTVADSSQQELLDAREERFSGDGIAMVRSFFELSAKGIMQAKPTIAGHYDLITKYNGNNGLFDENSAAYQQTALEYLDEILSFLHGYGGMIEVNTGAWTRGLREVPYPAPFLLKHIAARKARAIITTDSHKIETLNGKFDEAVELLRQTGFTSMAVLQNGKFVDVSL